MILNKNITVINEVGGKYISATFDNVSFIGKTERKLTDSGLVTADYFTVRIPDKQQFTCVKTVNELAEQYLQAENGVIIQAENCGSIEIGKNNCFALIPQKTFIAVGKVDFEELNDIAHLLKTYDVYTVMSVKDNRIGSHRVRHWRCDCK